MESLLLDWAIFEVVSVVSGNTVQSKIQSHSIYTIMLIDLIFTVHFYNNCVALSTICHIVSVHHSIVLYLLYEICLMFFTFTLPC